MLYRDAACRVSPDQEAASQHPARLVKLPSWIAPEQPCCDRRSQDSTGSSLSIYRPERTPHSPSRDQRFQVRRPTHHTPSSPSYRPRPEYAACPQAGKRIQPPKTSSSLFAPQEIASPATPERRLCTTQRPAQTRALCTRSHSRLRYNVCLLFPRQLRRGFMERELCRLT
jgi:hypothetical protein